MTNAPGPLGGGFLSDDAPLPSVQKDLLSTLDSLDDPVDFTQPPAPVPVPVQAEAPAAPAPDGPRLPTGLPTSPRISADIKPAFPDEIQIDKSDDYSDFKPPTAAPTRSGPTAPPEANEPGIIELSSDDMSDDDGEFISLDDALLYLLEKGGSDLHLSVGLPPMIRVRGDMEPIEGYPAFTPRSLQSTMYAILNERQKQKFEETKELDFAYSMPGAARFRVNMFQQKGATGAVLRTIPWEIKSLEELGMPESLGKLSNLPRGLVLVTGPTGSGKSTTLAAIIDRANRTRQAHIMTIEDPVEFVHQHRMSVVNQREVGEDTWSFAAALKHALRQDPDIILVGEMRDLETISIALTAAETGHLVFGTLHTSSAASTIDRIIDVFPSEQQAQIRTQIGSSIQAVICQALCKTADGKGRVAALEIMIATPAVRNLIREGKLQSIPSALQTGSKFGMQTLNQNLAELVKDGRITYEVAMEKASDLGELNQLLGKASEV